MSSNSSTYLPYTKPMGNTSLLCTSEYAFTFELNPQLFYNPTRTIELTNKIVTIPTIKSSKYNLKRPLAILITKENSEYKAEFPSLELYSFANSEDEAIDELINDFIDLCDAISSHTSNELGIYPKLWGKIINSIVK